MSSVEELNQTLSDIQAVVTNVKADTESLLAEIATLKEGAITAEQLQSLQDKATAIKESLSAVDAEVPVA